MSVTSCRLWKGWKSFSSERNINVHIFYCYIALTSNYRMKNQTINRNVNIIIMKQKTFIFEAFFTLAIAHERRWFAEKFVRTFQSDKFTCQPLIWCFCIWMADWFQQCDQSQEEYCSFSPRNDSSFIETHWLFFFKSFIRSTQTRLTRFDIKMQIAHFRNGDE